MPAVQNASKPKTTYHEILRSSALVGGSQLANIAIGILRTKAMALLLGPAGFGLFGLYGSIQSLAQSIAGMGINNSGVREISAAAGSGESERIAHTATILRRTAVVLGLLGAVLLSVCSGQISRITFGNTDHRAAISLLSIAVFFGSVSGGQTALIQGMRRIGDLAKMNMLGALFGLLASVILVYFYRQKGVVPSLVMVAAMGIVTSWWYSRKICIQPVAVSLSEVRQETWALLKLGSAFMASGLLTMGVAYVVRIMILRKIGLDAMGLYQSAWTLAGLYVGFILSAMGADFYPRLTARINDHADANRLVDEQTLIGMLLAAPGVMVTLTFAPLVMFLFYSAKFGAAVGVLRWICLGAALQVITWPMGFIIVAKGKPALFFAVEAAWAFIALALAWWCIARYGLNGAGIACLGSYVFHWILVSRVARGLTGYRCSAYNLQIAIVFLLLISLLFASFYVIPVIWATTLGTLLTIGSTVYSARVLFTLVPLEQIPSPLRKLLAPFCSIPRRTPPLCREIK